MIGIEVSGECLRIFFLLIFISSTCVNGREECDDGNCEKGNFICTVCLFLSVPFLYYDNSTIQRFLTSYWSCDLFLHNASLMIALRSVNAF